MIDLLRKNKPLIHCITNPIAINPMANAILAVGARPIMAEHPCEVREISASAKTLVLNLGNITDVRMESMLIAAKTGTPYILDPVGIGCSGLRREFFKQLTSICPPAVIKGNYSELLTLTNPGFFTSGIDAQSHSIKSVASAAAEISEKYGCITVASGKCDIIAHQSRIILIHNGTPLLSRITGTGCILGGICGCFFDGTAKSLAYACAVMGICGEDADKTGLGSFYTSFMDNLSNITDNNIRQKIQREEFEIEQIRDTDIFDYRQ